MLYCGSCGSELKPGQNFCVLCGTKAEALTEKKTDSSTEPAAAAPRIVPGATPQPSPAKKTGTVIWVTVGITAVLCLALLVVVLKHTSNTSFFGKTTSSATQDKSPSTEDYTPAPSASESQQGYGDNPQPQHYAAMTTADAEEIITAIYEASSRGDSDAFLNRFTDTVDYLGAGRVNRAFIRKEAENYRKRWPIITFQLEGEPALRQIPGQDVVVAENEVYFEVSDGERSIQGRARDTWTFRIDRGVWRVVAYKQKVLSRNKYGF